MSKPSWDDAPEWAKFLAMDENGVWFWHGDRPKLGLGMGEWLATGQTELAKDSESGWTDSLETRP